MDKKHISADDHIYLHGYKNLGYRMYFYMMNGLNILNEFRNLFLGIIGIYIALHMTNYLWMVVMFVPSLLGLIIIGRYNVHKLSKMGEWLSVRFSTHYGIKSYGFSQQQVELLQEIIDILKKQNVER